MHEQLWCAQTSRRSALGLLAAGAALVTHVRPSDAAYGESANIFGRVANNAGGYACRQTGVPHPDIFG